jgi:hypothetical protein
MGDDLRSHSSENTKGSLRPLAEKIRQLVLTGAACIADEKSGGPTAQREDIGCVAAGGEAEPGIEPVSCSGALLGIPTRGTGLDEIRIRPSSSTGPPDR